MNKQFFTLFSLTLLHLPAAAKTCNFPYSEPLEGEVAVVGQAVDSERERFKILNAFKGKEVSVGGGLATLSASLVRHYDEIYEKTYLKRGGKFGIGPFKFSKSREFTTTITKKNYTATFMLMFEVNLPNGKWQIDTSGGTPLTDYAQTLVNKPCEFKRIFGDSFIFQTQRGARVYVAINVSFSSDERLKDFNRGMDGSLEGKFNGFTKSFCGSCGIEKVFKIPAFDFSASFDSIKNNISNSTLRDGKIEIIAMQIGGDASRLGQIFGSGGDVTLTSCSLDALANCDDAFKNVLAYLAQEQFAEGVKAHPEVISYLHRGYWEVDPSIQLVNEITPEIETARKQLAENLLEREQDLNAVKTSLTISLSYGHHKQLKSLKLQLEQDIENLKIAGFTCFSDLANCTQKAAPVLAGLKAYDRAVVNPNPADGLVAYYPFNANALDESGNGNDGTVHGATLTEDRYGNKNSAYLFNGHTTISINHSETLNITNNGLSIAVWIKPAAGQRNEFPTILSKHTGGSAQYHLSLQSGGYGVKLRNCNRNCGSVLNTEEWSFVVLNYTYNSTNYMYLNGNIDTLTKWNKYSNNSTHLTIGVAPYGTWSWPYVGLIDDIRFYNRALSDTEIKQIHTATTNINQPPLAMFTTSAVQGAPLTINLNATDSSDADGSISNYNWLSSAGQTANGKTASLNFTNPGEYNITLTVTDDKGATSQAVKNINLQASRIITNPCNNTTITDCRSNYLSNGKLCAPCVIVHGALGSSQIFAVEMNTQPFSQTFKVDLPSLRQHNFQDSCAANYSPISGSLKLPCVFDGTKNYAMEMQQRRGSLIFDITGVR